MKILHWAIILVIIVFPISMICRINVNAKFSALKDEVRINNALDTATKDAIDQLISANQAIVFDGEFGDVIDINPDFAQEMVDTFFHTMAVNYNIPYQTGDFSSNQSESYIKNYFSTYVPAIVIVAYDGFYIYSLEDNGSGYEYQMSSKIPYAYQVTANSESYYDNGDSNYVEDYFTVGYTLGDDMYLSIDGERYSGRLNNNLNDVETKVKEYYESYIYTHEGDTEYEYTRTDFAKYINTISTDISCVLYALSNQFSSNALFSDDILDRNGSGKVWSFSQTQVNGDIDYVVAPIDGILTDYKYNETGEIIQEASPYNIKKDDVIINLITTALNEEINDHQQFANISGVTYRFSFPTVSRQDWVNTIDDISFLAFVQGIPIGNAKGTYYNNFALGGSKIIKSGYIYTTKIGENYYYHTSKCSVLPRTGDNEVDYLHEDIHHIFKSKKAAATPAPTDGYDGANPCFICN